jgi:hypothetical protein
LRHDTGLLASRLATLQAENAADPRYIEMLFPADNNGMFLTNAVCPRQ